MFNEKLCFAAYRRRIAGILFVAMLLLRLLAGCSRSTDEEQIRNVIAAAETAAEARNTSDAMELVANDYRDAQGFDKPQLRNFLRGYFITHPKIELLVRVGEIKLETTNSARASIELTLVGTRQSDASSASLAGASLTGEQESLQIDFKRSDSNWRVVRVDRVAN